MNMEHIFEEVYTEYFSTVYLYILTLCYDEHIAEEVTQEAFFKALKNIQSFKGNCKMYTWLCQIAKNTLYDYVKKERKRQSLDEQKEEWIVAVDVEEEFERKEQQMNAQRALHTLAEPYKEVFMLRVFAELSFKQIGEIFNQSDTWARVVFYRAKNQLVEEMK